MPRERRPIPCGQQVETIVQSLSNMLDGQGLNSCRSQLDRKRDAIQPQANLGNRLRVCRVYIKSRVNALGTFNKQAWCFKLIQSFTREWLTPIGKRKRRHAVLGFSQDTQYFPAGQEQMHMLGSLQQLICNFCTRRGQVFTVIKNQQESFCTKEIVQYLDRRAT